MALIEQLTGTDFLDAHLFTDAETVQLTTAADGTARFSLKKNSPAPSALTPLPESADTPGTQSAAQPPPTPSAPSSGVQPSTLGAQRSFPPAPVAAISHDRPRGHLVPITTPWLRPLGITNARGQPVEAMAGKFRQINKFVELLSHLAAEANLIPAAKPLDAAFATQPSSFVSQPSALNAQPSASSPAPLRIADMGSGKGYLTFATAAFFGPRADVLGIETRPELVELCNRLARENNLPTLRFAAGTIADAKLESLDILIALHACDIATDDALLRGINAGARLLVVSPCCQKELRPQLTAPAVLADALRHGIFQERHAEFVTDALRAQLLEWAGYKTKVFEFISTEHTAKNLMISAIKARDRGTANDPTAEKIRAFARFYGIRHHQLATHLGLAL
ncbi:methyltransferase [Nibricoccus aquaticus]|uniref:Methyltransferase n=1 Tax=Nibricoccus aquaticus TaxID=2576891 RepID=A0A290QCE7_9BACT|nr:methyltransferase [Nibricoccus aquaticus]